MFSSLEFNKGFKVFLSFVTAAIIALISVAILSSVQSEKAVDKVKSAPISDAAIKYGNDITEKSNGEIKPTVSELKAYDVSIAKGNNELKMMDVLRIGGPIFVIIFGIGLVFVVLTRKS